MIPVPVGVEDHRVNRVPVVAFTVIAICVLVYFIDMQMKRQGGRLFEQAWQYYQEHPYLELYSGALDRLGIDTEQIRARREAVKQQAEAYAELSPELAARHRKLFGAPAESDVEEESRRREQARLDDLMTRALRKMTLQRTLGFFPAHPSPVAVISYMFVHAGFWHLLGNMLFFYLTAPLMEDRWGRGFFAAFYLGAGVFSAVLFGLGHSSDQSVFLAGASGAVAGVMGAFAYKHGRRRMTFRIYYLFLFIGPYWQFKAPAWIMLPIWAVSELLLAVEFDIATGIAHWAHVWGFAFGVGTAACLHLGGYERKLNATYFDPDYPERDPIQGAEYLVEQGLPMQALEILANAFTQAPNFSEVINAYWSLALRENATSHILRSGRRLLNIGLDGNETEDAFYFWGVLTSRSSEFVLEPAPACKLAGLLVESEKPRDASHVLWITVERMKKPTGAQLTELAVAAKPASWELAAEIARYALTGKTRDEDKKVLESIVDWAGSQHTASGKSKGVSAL